MKQFIGATSFMLLALTACSEAPKQIEASTAQPSLAVHGVWIKSQNGAVMGDPQTSGLTLYDGKLVSISDASAKSDLQRKLHFIDPATAVVTSETEKMRLGNQVRRSCFSDYLADEPDLEALVADPNQPGVFYTVTEDATRTGALSPRCQQQYENTGSTDYPTLLVKLEMNEFGTTMSGVRPLQYAVDMQVGDFPNDGIEGMAMKKDGTLFLGLEKDANGQPRLFSVNMDDKFWDTTDFVKVTEPGLSLPHFDSGNHPINGLTYYQSDAGEGFLLAAARNDNELWVISENPDKAYKRVLMHFTAPVDGDAPSCDAEEIMDNASIEGLEVVGDTLWMINDPWKVNYLKNIRCEANSENYNAMAPLLYSVPLNPAWFE